MENNYKIKIGTFKSFKYFSEKGMVFGSNEWNNDFYDIFEGETCEFAVFEDGSVFHKGTKTQVNPDDIDFGCELCSGSTIENKNSIGYVTEYSIEDGVLFIETNEEHSSETMKINYCPMCGRKLKIDE